VHAQEREGGIRNRVDETARQIPALRAQTQVVAAKRHDPRLARAARQDGEAVGMNPCAHDRMAGDNLTAVR
jgi:hypothetical protein